jgi:DNA-binding transcriptional regulator LsrR (DeoR family)
LGYVLLRANNLKEVMNMTDYREILRLRYLGINHSQIAASLGISRQTVVTTLQRAASQGVDWQTA